MIHWVAAVSKSRPTVEHQKNYFDVARAHLLADFRAGCDGVCAKCEDCIDYLSTCQPLSHRVALCYQGGRNKWCTKG
jgi:hypothetical protein